MSQVSKYLLNPGVQQRIFEVFWNTIADLHSTTDVQNFFHELLSPSERIMLSKRLAIAILLIKNYTYEDIGDVLKVSRGTIANSSYWLENGGGAFKKSIEKLLKKEKQEEFWDNLEEFFSGIIVPRKGSNWSQARSNQLRELKNRRLSRSIL